MRDWTRFEWDSFKPNSVCTLCFILVDNQLLLIRRKVEPHVGLVNGPGGKVEPGETADQASIRECYEETGAIPVNQKHRGTLKFAFDNEFNLRVEVYLAEQYEGEIHETDEAVPFWCQVNQIPYDETWPDDPYWIPVLLDLKEERKFECRAKLSDTNLMEIPQLTFQ